MPTILVFDFSRPGSDASWHGIHDRVMGGESTGALRRTGEGGAIFEGVVSLANGGGFASVRSPVDAARLAGATALRLRVRGDGRTYRLTAGTTEQASPATWAFTFATRAGEWQEVLAPLARFVHRVHGRETPAPPLVAGDIRSIGFVAGDGKAGPFRLEVERLEATTEPPGSPSSAVEERSPRT
jgi:hypothetical protein